MTCCSKLALNCAQGLAQCVDRKYSVRGHIKTFCWSARRQPWTNASRPTEAASQAVHVPATTGDGIWFQRTQRQVMTTQVEELGEQDGILKLDHFSACCPGCGAGNQF